MDEENATNENISERTQKKLAEETANFSIFEGNIEDPTTTSKRSKRPPSRPKTNSKAKDLGGASPPLFESEIIPDSGPVISDKTDSSIESTDEGKDNIVDSHSDPFRDQNIIGSETRLNSSNDISDDEELLFVSDKNENLPPSLASSQHGDNKDSRANFSRSGTRMSKTNLVNLVKNKLNSSSSKNKSQDKGYQVEKAIITGFIIAGVVLGALKLGTFASLILGMIVVITAISEAYFAFRRAGYKPAALLGIVATGVLMVSGYYQGTRNLALIITLMVVFSFIWYLSGVITTRPALNIAITLLPFLWIGFLGSFVAFLLSPTFSSHNYGIAYLLAAILNASFYDIGGLFAGKRFGRHCLASNISPNKTWEGLIGGSVAVLAVSALVISNIHPWNLSSALLLAVVVIIVEPIGDLCESLVKRDFGIKDMGGWLPGHGGMLDRIDGLLFVLPATYYLIRVLHLG